MINGLTGHGDDGGWVIQQFTDGGGYLIYPSPKGSGCKCTF